ncbi:DUF58 domain-containing protein [Geomonas sp. RF6]|uniref:DUF58 domain-containing protein n=1 Tax=Geomonas sp. RF6 TaxID=2897342 RepID=UPI001E4BDC8E|nr:DUF58 domain-containing protein [Geomonas sp. RF6]UFS70948.1 DUF58 domain-containing protein [Geomonas sp. RF6]
MPMEKTEKTLLSKKELLEIFVNHRVDSPFPGDWESVFKGLGYEFWALRELEPTDSFKNIDWKAKARTGKFFVRDFLAESYFNVMILYDVSRSVQFGRKELLQAHIAVSLAYSAIASNDGCGLILFADDIVKYIPPRMGRTHFMEILDAIVHAEPVRCGGTSLGPALTKLLNEVPESLTFILSDFLYPLDFGYTFHHAAQGSTKHEVKALQVLEECEIALPPGTKGILPLYDYESGRTVSLDLTKWQAFNDTMSRQREGTRTLLGRAGIDLLTVSPADDFGRKINSFMRRPPSTY